jgi:hypothetical protein
MNCFTWLVSKLDPPTLTSLVPGFQACTTTHGLMEHILITY